MAEKLAFHEVFRQSAAVDGDKRAAVRRLKSWIRRATTTKVGRMPDSTSASIVLEWPLRWSTTRIAAVGERESGGEVALRGAVDQEPRPLRAPNASAARRCARSNGVGVGPMSMPQVSAGMSWASAARPITSTQARVRAGPALVAGDVQPGREARGVVADRVEVGRVLLAGERSSHPGSLGCSARWTDPSGRAAACTRSPAPASDSSPRRRRWTPTSCLLDLEDAAAEGEKEQARARVIEALDTLDFGRATVDRARQRDRHAALLPRPRSPSSRGPARTWTA